MADAAVHGHDGHDERGFFTRWFMSTNHKDIGILYLFTAGIVGFISVAFTVYMRMELMSPGVQFMCLEGASLFPQAAENCTPNGHLWNVLITGHGILMMFFVVIPALFGGFGNYFMPLQIGAPDMAVAMGRTARASAGCSIRPCRPPKPVSRPISRSLPCTCRAPRRSWARST